MEGKKFFKLNQVVYCVGGSIISPFDGNLEEHWKLAISNSSLLKPYYPFSSTSSFNHLFHSFYSHTNYVEFGSSFSTNASFFSADHFVAMHKKKLMTKCAVLCVEAIEKAQQNSSIQIHSNRVGLIIASTKGDIDLINSNSKIIGIEPFSLNYLGLQVKTYFQLDASPIILSNACISGTQAIGLAGSLIKNGFYDHIFVVGVDLVSRFTLEGFQSFKALSNDSCKPFDIERNGLSIGEGSACLVLSCNKQHFMAKHIALKFSSVRLDASHISAPSREGKGLTAAINEVLFNEVRMPDVISLHGTATIYNDEMEAQALHNTGLSCIPAFGSKGIFGHTLGNSGVLESLLLLISMIKNIIPPTLGFKNLGTSKPLKILDHPHSIPLHLGLKCSSGFGGVNATLLFEKL